MTFDEWMLTVAPTHKPSDDGVTLRTLRACWKASEAAERKRWATAARLCVEATPEQLPIALDALSDVIDA